ncbi:hypothetical protein EVG20_g830 [Dentipellis fragilis]|uniref:ENTH domain-containing protein n=1 Tax=Dentipellis fragilis TaxID=205917 RepID=A0A4Y9ZC92_9AGAM|nr:hypothetical protein EVG20_g830 [Dentipellis fragilis]
MDRLESLGSTLSNLTMYDIKSMYNQAKNVVLNVSEMEAKVREATNDDPWGASSTLMQDIAQGTFNFQNFNEIMPCIYSQFMEKEARQWRQIYKSLQLLEYLVKNGSERVIDDARSHVSTIKMLRNFHYIDDKGKDQGINVRNRSRELVELLSDVEKIRIERRKAKANRSKYIGTGSDGMSFSGGGGRYGGFGSESVSGSFGGGYGERASGLDREYGGSYSGSSSSNNFRDETSRKGYDEYDAGDYETPRRSNSVSQRAGGSGTSSRSAAAAPAPKAPEPAKEVDLLGFGDEEPAAPANIDKALPALAPLSVATDAADDDFADFQAAPPSAPPSKPNLMDLLNSTPAAAPAPAPAVRSSMASPAQYSASSQAPSYGGFNNIMSAGSQVQARPASFAASPPPMMASSSVFSQPAMTPASPPPRSNTAPMTATATKSSGNFDDLWTMSLGAAASKPTPASGASKSIKDLAQEKAQANIWGAGAARPQSQAAASSTFGSFAGPPMGASSSAPAGGADDLLL